MMKRLIEIVVVAIIILLLAVGITRLTGMQGEAFIVSIAIVFVFRAFGQFVKADRLRKRNLAAATRDVARQLQDTGLFEDVKIHL